MRDILEVEGWVSYKVFRSPLQTSTAAHQRSPSSSYSSFISNLHYSFPPTTLIHLLNHLIPIVANMRLSLITILPLLTSALPTPQTTCGTAKYTAAQITAAKNAACNYHRQGTTAGGSKYPESYQDREGFTFHGVDGPYFEFPILSSGKVYSGGEFFTFFLS